jgi:transcription antitermination factor NusG
LQEKSIRRSGRRFVSHLPLFPSYVFFRGPNPERKLVLESNLIVHTLEVRDQSLLYRELRDLWQLQQTGVPLVPHPYLEPGDLVEITDGPFTGYRGRVLREKGRLRLVVSISLLRQSVAAEFDREVLAPAPGSYRRRVAASAG